MSSLSIAFSTPFHSARRVIDARGEDRSAPLPYPTAPRNNLVSPDFNHQRQIVQTSKRILGRVARGLPQAEACRGLIKHLHRANAALSKNLN
jgi:hypothetical protein